MDLPGNVAMSITMEIAKRIVQGNGEKVTSQQMMLRQRDNLPYLNKQTANISIYIEPVYLSSHFDMDSQQILDPVNLPHLLSEITFNDRIPLVERTLLVLRLQQQKLLGKGINKDQDIQDIIHEIKVKNKDNKDAGDIEMHGFDEIYTLVDTMAEKLYLYISREEIQKLKSLGVIGSQVTNIVAKDLRKLNIDVKAKAWEKKSKLRAQMGRKSFASGQLLLGKGKQKAVAVPSTKKIPYDQPRSKLFF